MPTDRRSIKSPHPMPEPSKADPFQQMGRKPDEALADAEESLRDRPMRILKAGEPRKRSR